MGGNHVSETVMSRLVTSIRQSGAIQRAMGDAEGYVERALELLYHFPENTPRNALEGLARYFVSRKF
jgi:geranylgeranyl pyrophosphate synthase